MNYYSQELPPLFEKADVLYHIIYSDILKGLVVSIIATIIFTWYSEYRNFSKNFFLFLYLEYYIKELWTFLYNMEYQAYKNYMDLSIENIVELTEQIDQTSIKIEWDESSLNKLNKINNEIEKIFLYMYTPVNQDIYYLIKSIDFIIDNHMFKENITISLSERIIAILKGLESFKKNPINSIIE